MEAETSYVKSTTIEVDNMMEHRLLYAYTDAMNCALLKEAVMDFMVKNRTEAEVLDKVGVSN
ncbi:hypothetical protein ACHAXR_001621 [Thalassiosira sp. AJA248-18]